MDDYLILDLNKQRIKFRSNRPTVVRQGEIDSAPLNVQITRDSEPYRLTGCNVYFEAERGDGHKFVEPASVTSVENGFVSITLPSGLALQDGVIQLAYFAVYTPGGEVITTETMDIVTLPGICMFTDSDYIPYIERIIAELETYLDNAEALTNTVDDLVAQATQMLSDVNEALNTSEAAVSICEAATAEATYAASRANSAASNVGGMIHSAVSHITGVWLDATAADSLDTLARNSCTSGIFVNGSWYVHAGQIAFADGQLLVKGSEPQEGRMRLPTVRCSADQALMTGQYALARGEAANRKADANAAEIEDLMAQIAALQAAVSVLAMNAGSYPFYMGGSMYVRGVSISAGIMTVPTASYDEGRMHIAAM